MSDSTRMIVVNRTAMDSTQWYAVALGAMFFVLVVSRLEKLGTSYAGSRLHILLLRHLQHCYLPR